jgi:hypothetical protein
VTHEVCFVGLEAPTWACERMPLEHLPEIKIPILAVKSGRGLVTAVNAFLAIKAKFGRKLKIKELPGYTHLGILAARAGALAAG